MNFAKACACRFATIGGLRLLAVSTTQHDAPPPVCDQCGTVWRATTDTENSSHE